MRGRIDDKGLLEIWRGRNPKNSRCGEWCPLFRSDSEQVILCNGTVIFIDEEAV